MTVIENLLRERVGPARLAEHGIGDRFSVVFITPRFLTSRHLVALVLDAQGTERLVVKVPRRPGDDAAVRREAGVLTAYRSGGLAAAPQVLGVFEEAGSSFLVETALRGRVLDPAEVRRSFDAAVTASTAFVTALPRTAEPVRTDWYAETLAAPLALLRDAMPVGSDVHELVERTAEALGPLRGAELPRVLQHGDLSHPNLLLDDEGALQVMDWERADPRGLPGLDLVFVLTHLAESRRLAFERDAQVASFEDAFWSGSSWAAPALAAHLHTQGVDVALVPQIVLACWARSVATLAERLALRGGNSGHDELGLALQQDRDFALWRRSLELVQPMKGGRVATGVISG